jgi:transcriptional regulator with XRE-family HTH domain
MDTKKMSLVIGSQLRAARALVGVEQIELATVAGVHPNTVRAMEARGVKEITGSVTALRRVERAMESFGVEFTNGEQPGVRLSVDAHELAGIKQEVLRKAKGAGDATNGREALPAAVAFAPA